MENTAYSARFLQQRKFYMMLPLLVLPFVTLIYWVLFVKGTKKQQQTTQSQGLITSLPDAMLKEDKEVNKLSFYERAAADSAKLGELIRKDPYRSDSPGYKDSLQTGQLAGLGAPFKAKAGQVNYQGKTSVQAGEEKVLKKLKALDDVLSETSRPEFSRQDMKSENSPRGDDNSGNETADKLEALMAGLNQQSSAPDVYEDPELKELSGMLDKIIQIQNPELDSEKIKEQSEKSVGQVFAVRQAAGADPVSLLATDSTEDSVEADPVRSISFEQNGFFGLDETLISADQNAIPAVIAQTQTVVSGSTVKLRLTQDVYIAGVLIPKESFVYGIANLNNERLVIRIESVRHENNLFPVKLSVYDLDGIAGIHIPGAIARDVAKQSLSQDIQGISIGSLDPSLGAQAASAGIQTAKTLIGKKARLLQVTVKAGYQVLLRDGNASS
ncbi:MULTISPECIES: conjugative transposon protein TraM [Dyadobacter]|jgi:conjugative transposon TraM protein|uniref:Conjugative transposon protein TraM n=1 Tax=Dyadobacter psychrotolerans TaxID=2541721 RepID=A0A4R5DHB5_9BACT|nr:conjugative transposon protein TraM [Dyadobacter psychrotolerans]TDE13229.1 conjugative transposon protein TraM [Dyadobacter psychrotolerans]